MAADKKENLPDLPSISPEHTFYNLWPNWYSEKTLKTIYYFSDLHLDNKLLAEGIIGDDDAVTEYLENLLFRIRDNTFNERHPSTETGAGIFIGGDVSSDPRIVDTFLGIMSRIFESLPIFYVLGNHELWYCVDGMFNPDHLSVDQIVNEYRKIASRHSVHLLHNDLFCYRSGSVVFMNEKTLREKTCEQIAAITSNCDQLIFGGVGFSGLNHEFNATHGIYRNTITTPEEDLEHTMRFQEIYRKLFSIYSDDGRMTVLVHTPPHNWNPDMFTEFWPIFHGHDHKNVRIADDYLKEIADCQWGYESIQEKMGRFCPFERVDIFEEFGDGIYKISLEQYSEFNYNLSLPAFLGCNGQVYMLKRDGYYAFFFKPLVGKLTLLNGGRRLTIDNTDLGYYYENMPRLVHSINMRVEKVMDILGQISDEVKRFGGSGRIHGLIVDIDFFNHLYLDPFTREIRPYYALDMKHKVFYPDVRTLLEHYSKRMLPLYDKKVGSSASSFPLILTNPSGIKEETYEPSTEMYLYSNKLRRLQYIFTDNVLREWDENFLNILDPKTIGNIDAGTAQEIIQIPEIVDLTRSGYYNNASVLSSDEEEKLKRIVSEELEKFFETGESGFFIKKLARNTVTRCKRNHLDGGDKLELRVYEAFAELFDDFLESEITVQNHIAGMVDLLTFDDEIRTELRHHLRDIVWVSNRYSNLPTRKKQYIVDRFVNRFFMELVYSPDRMDAFVESVFAQDWDVSRKEEFCLSQSAFFAKTSDSCNGANLDNLQLYVKQRMAVISGIAEDVNPKLREHIAGLVQRNPDGSFCSLKPVNVRIS